MGGGAQLHTHLHPQGDKKKTEQDKLHKPRKCSAAFKSALSTGKTKFSYLSVKTEQKQTGRLDKAKTFALSRLMIEGMTHCLVASQDGSGQKCTVVRRQVY